MHLFDGENISFDASLVKYINSTNIPPIMIVNRIYENLNLLSLYLVSFLVGLRTYQHPSIGLNGWILVGGQVDPSSVVGDSVLWKNALLVIIGTSFLITCLIRQTNLHFLSNHLFGFEAIDNS